MSLPAARFSSLSRTPVFVVRSSVVEDIVVTETEDKRSIALLAGMCVYARLSHNEFICAADT